MGGPFLDVFFSRTFFTVFSFPPSLLFCFFAFLLKKLFCFSTFSVLCFSACLPLRFCVFLLFASVLSFFCLFLLLCFCGFSLAAFLLLCSMSFDGYAGPSWGYVGPSWAHVGCYIAPSMLTRPQDANFPSRALSSKPIPHKNYELYNHI